MTKLQRVRLCSAVYAAYQRYVGETVRRTNTVEMDECFGEALIELETKDSVGVASMDLIKCTFTPTSSVSSFYLADDVSSENKAFVVHRIDDYKKASLERRPGLESSYEITYRLVLHVQNLTQLGNNDYVNANDSPKLSA